MDARTWIEDFRSRARKPERIERPLRQEDVWGTAGGPIVWQAPSFEGLPNYYPIYRWGDFYSYSPLALVLLKGSYRPSEITLRSLMARPDFNYVPAHMRFEEDIERIGGPRPLRSSIRSQREFVQKMAGALNDDIASVENRHPGYANAIMVGGKDSLNLLLLDWKNPVFVFSAAPNFELVKQFIERNDLKYHVEELHDSPEPDWVQIECALNMGRLNLGHHRWADQLRRIAASFDRRVIFWMGQLGDVFMTPLWRSYSDRPERIEKRLRWAYSRRHQMLPERLDAALAHLVRNRLSQSLWRRGAAYQGVNHSLLRDLTGAHPLSGYHGPEVQSVLASASLPAITRTDPRINLGTHLGGREIWYPQTNPGPPLSVFRSKIPDLSTIREAVEQVAFA